MTSQTTTAGFMVLIRNDRTGQVTADWDGEVHPTQAAVNEECIKARQAGWDAFTVKLVSRRALEIENVQR